ncbi:alkaline phosphatase family protein [Aeromonas salmonicida]|uniref:Alkaline phosphatase family protein n=1 Tax=Escherichia coli TaxID=562 RepID=A0A3L0X4L4_ECOLX|nr:alkaline phosphatase family protein [Aeromonas salmonicida]MDR6996964.1 putative AlkP superfamily pyrophosphatase or phosphodiesterase [Aeromonas salmonicida]HEH9413746.1 alkaline phosphatase family protein [Aeromonas salmonicida]HEH9422753.1 alkaline phosphatase family protein [Aeromonas salmonicida]HEH9435811.1 alkaline phosphatase family protein [Aeromonas salmonicida]
MQHKVIVVLVDGLSAEVAHTMGYLTGMVEAERGLYTTLSCALPSLSRPLYECILTGVPPVASGITHNGVSRLSQHESIFHLARAGGKRTAAAAYYWVSELYNHSPWLVLRDRYTHDEQLPIQHGCFYWDDSYPDSHLLMDGEWLRTQHDPDFLLIHPMGVDDAGHQFGLDSCQYRNQARRMDSLLADLLPQWLGEGYQVLVTSDHGMNNDLSHGGTLPEERTVPLWLFGDAFVAQWPAGPALQQTQLCGLMADLLGVAHDKPSGLPLLKAACLREVH